MRQRLLIILSSFVLLVASCSVNPEMPDDPFASSDETSSEFSSTVPEETLPEKSFESVEITYSEPVEQYAFRLKMSFIQTELARYYFEPSIDERERNACIEVTERVLADQISYGSIPEIYVFSQDRYSYRYIKDHMLYCSVRDWRSVAYVTDVLLAAYGASAHYGTAFGYANYLAEKYEWEHYNSRFSAPFIMDILDLNHLCFDECFVTPDDALIAKEISSDFFNSYLILHGEEKAQQLLTSLKGALNALTSYYADHGISYTPSAIQYGYGGKSFDYIVYSDYGTIYVSQDWVDMNAEGNPLITDGFLHDDYAETKAFFETNIDQMRKYQELFNLESYDNNLEIVFTKPLDVSKYSFYQVQTHRIFLYNVDSWMHEYIHALTPFESTMQNWQVEGFARYFSYYYDHYGIAFLNYDYNHLPDSATTKYVQEYLATINRPIDMAKDYQELENAAVYSYGFTNPNANYLTGSSFIQYLVKQYGEDAVIQSIYGSKKPLPKNYLELVRDWISYIDNNYDSYSKYE